MKKRNHPANVVDVSSRIMGLLGRRKVDPTTEAMKAFKPDFVGNTHTIEATVTVPDNVTIIGPGGRTLGETEVGGYWRPSEALRLEEHRQFCGRIARQPPLSDEERQRWIDVLERMLCK